VSTWVLSSIVNSFEVPLIDFIVVGDYASIMLARQRIAAAPAALARGATKSFSSASSRSFVTTKSTRPSPSQLLSKQQRSTFARRAYATEAPAAPKKKRFRFLRWTYRLTVLGLLAGTGYLGYSIYLLRHPEEQIEPDPSKKTLVILGSFPFLLLCSTIDYNF
jgi:NADH:ubiquinone reductase (non-electrogenic)